MCIFLPLSNTVYEWVEWMWRMSERSVCGLYVKRIRVLLAFAKKILEIHSYVFLFCFDDNVET